nr:hypothetical protein TetV2_00468 [Oceanusvirus sp.]
MEAARRAVNRAADPVAAFLRDQRTALALALTFAGMGVVLMGMHADLPQWYPILLAFFTFKTVFNYRKCTISYIECKVVRGVSRERGVVDSLANGVTDLRRNPGWTALTLAFASIVWSYYWFYRGQRPKI